MNLLRLHLLGIHKAATLISYVSKCDSSQWQRSQVLGTADNERNIFEGERKLVVKTYLNTEGTSREKFSNRESTPRETFSNREGMSRETFSSRDGTPHENFSEREGRSREIFSKTEGMSRDTF